MGLDVVFVRPRATVKLGGSRRHAERQAEVRQAALAAGTRCRSRERRDHRASVGVVLDLARHGRGIDSR